MVVYGQRKTKYVLGSTPVSGDYDGAIYPVSGRGDILVKIFPKNMRDMEKENEVIAAMNGLGVSIFPQPIDMVYERGKFAGYVIENQEAYNKPPEPEITPPATTRTLALPPVAVILMLLCSGLGISAIFLLKIFPMLAVGVFHRYTEFYFGGIPAVIGGWVGLILAVLATKDKDQEIGTFVAGVVAFVVGLVLICLANWLIVMALAMALNVLAAVLPSIILIVALIYVVKSVLR